MRIFGDIGGIVEIDEVEFEGREIEYDDQNEEGCRDQVGRGIFVEGIHRG